MVICILIVQIMHKFLLKIV